jgi:hypothetical protein
VVAATAESQQWFTQPLFPAVRLGVTQLPAGRGGCSAHGGGGGEGAIGCVLCS